MSDRNLTVEVRGIGFGNLGAELMFLAIREEVLRRYPKARIAVEASNAYMSRSHFPAWQVLQRSYRGKSVVRAGNIAAQLFGSRLGLLGDKDVDVVFDASGYAFGDFWGHKKARSRLTAHIDRWASQNKFSVLLPQAMGPFKQDEQLKTELARALPRLDLMFVRDAVSASHVTGLTNKACTIVPDLTIGYDAKKWLKFTRHDLEKRVVVVPNSKMIESGQTERAAYIDMLARLVTNIVNANLPAAIMAHGGLADKKLMEEISQELDGAIADRVIFVHEEHPGIAKAMLGTAGLVLASRFHALVNALSQGVPVLAIGWSHKYAELLRDFDNENSYIDLNMLASSDSSQILNAIASGLEEPDAVKAARLQRRLATSARVGEMWDEIFDEMERKLSN